VLRTVGERLYGTSGWWPDSAQVALGAVMAAKHALRELYPDLSIS